MNTKNNQRFRNMDTKLKAAVLELLKEMDFDKITVSETVYCSMLCSLFSCLQDLIIIKTATTSTIAQTAPPVAPVIT